MHAPNVQQSNQLFVVDTGITADNNVLHKHAQIVHENYALALQMFINLLRTATISPMVSFGLKVCRGQRKFSAGTTARGHVKSQYMFEIHLKKT